MLDDRHSVYSCIDGAVYPCVGITYQLGRRTSLHPRTTRDHLSPNHTLHDLLAVPLGPQSAGRGTGYPSRETPDRLCVFNSTEDPRCPPATCDADDTVSRTQRWGEGAERRDAFFTRVFGAFDGMTQGVVPTCDESGLVDQDQRDECPVLPARIMKHGLEVRKEYVMRKVALVSHVPDK